MLHRFPYRHPRRAAWPSWRSVTDPTPAWRTVFAAKTIGLRSLPCQGYQKNKVRLELSLAAAELLTWARALCLPASWRHTDRQRATPNTCVWIKTGPGTRRGQRLRPTPRCALASLSDRPCIDDPGANCRRDRSTITPTHNRIRHWAKQRNQQTGTERSGEESRLHRENCNAASSRLDTPIFLIMREACFFTVDSVTQIFVAI